MKKAPKKFRKGYLNGTASAGVQETDENGNPIVDKQKGGTGDKIGQSMGWLQYANVAQNMVRGNIKKDTVTDPETGEQSTKAKTEIGGIKNNFSVAKFYWNAVLLM